MLYKDSCMSAIKKEILDGNLQNATDILHLILVTCSIDFNETKQGRKYDMLSFCDSQFFKKISRVIYLHILPEIDTYNVIKIIITNNYLL